jgi:hypothetical protein
MDTVHASMTLSIGQYRSIHSFADRGCKNKRNRVILVDATVWLIIILTTSANGSMGNQPTISKIYCDLAQYKKKINIKYGGFEQPRSSRGDLIPAARRTKTVDARRR